MEKVSIADASLAKRPVTYRQNKGRFFLIVPLVLFGALCMAAVPFSKTARGFFLSRTSTGIGTLTITAKNDGTFDVAEIPDYWFAPNAIGKALDYAMQSRYGKIAKPDQVNVMVKADIGASDDAIRTAIGNARTHGFVHFGFADAHLSQLAQESAPVPDADTAK